LWELAQAGLPLGWFSALRPEAVANGLQYGPWLLALLFLHLSRVFLRLPGAGWRWWLFGGAWGAARLGLDLARPRLPDPLWAGGGWEIGHSDLYCARSQIALLYGTLQARLARQNELGHAKSVTYGNRRT